MTKTVSGFAGSARFVLLAGVATLAFPVAAQAQSTDAQDAQAQTNSDADNYSDAQDAGTGNEIIVTATKREQTLQETPVAVSVTTAETIERAQIRDVTDLASVVPSLKVSQNQSQFATRYSIRGFGTDGNNLGLEPSVAMFVDGVYRSRAVAQISDLPDIQRVEVLRGPQSTLFGKNASAGVISIVTREPSFDFGGSVEASYGNYDAMVVKGYLTGPITDTVAASIAGGYNRRDGYLTNAYNGDDVNDRNRYFVRGQLLLEPSDTFKFRVIGDYDAINEKCCGVLNVQPSAATLAIRAVGGDVNDYRTPFADVIYSDVVPDSKVRNWGVSGQGDLELGALTLTSITAYRQTKLNADQDVDFTSARSATGANVGQAKLKTFTQELRLASDFDGPVNFLVGGYYFNEDVNTADQIVYGEDFREYANILIGGPAVVTSPPNDFAVDSLEGTISALTGQNYINKFFQPGQGFFNRMTQKDEAFSIFGNVDFEVTDGLTITLGANYTDDRKKVVTDSVSTDVFSGLDLTAIGRTAIYQQGLATQVGTLLGLGRLATGAEIQAFAGANPAAFAAVNTGVQAFAAANARNPAVNPLLALRPLQFLPPFQNCPNAVEDCRTHDSDWSYTARIAYEISPTLNMYASYATGFKASSFNLSRDSRPTEADAAALRQQGLAVTNLAAGSRFAEPEDSTVYELGLKGNWGLAAANLTFFQQSIKNFQTNTFTGTGFIFSNADEQSTFGVEFDGYVRPIKPLTLSLAMTYLDPKYDSFVNSPFGDLSGESIVTIPKLSAVFGAQWDQELGNGDNLILRSDFSYSAPVQVVQGLPGFIVINPDGSRDFGPALAAARPFRAEVNDLNASITYAMQNGLEVSLWGRNLLDDRNITTVFDSVAQKGSISGYSNQPRTYGVSARFKF
ncbi:TonB-dependent receptor [Tsuneonella deserti]|uniref:TonB-dependent receptor n=1 Tax=Tsuneonella deserti TaxID=2035528 RepID=A0ABQ1S5H6_9SPHN|nr:TonB-dependent receptor [Tsuneonella deserti]GGD90248.1 TonB-dependent receptor [Tsuneonella deserti]